MGTQYFRYAPIAGALGERHLPLLLVRWSSLIINGINKLCPWRFFG